MTPHKTSSVTPGRRCARRRARGRRQRGSTVITADGRDRQVGPGTRRSAPRTRAQPPARPREPRGRPGRRPHPGDRAPHRTAQGSVSERPCVFPRAYSRLSCALSQAFITAAPSASAFAARALHDIAGPLAPAALPGVSRSLSWSPHACRRRPPAIRPYVRPGVRALLMHSVFSSSAFHLHGRPSNSIARPARTLILLACAA